MATRVLSIFISVLDLFKIVRFSVSQTILRQFSIQYEKCWYAISTALNPGVIIPIFFTLWERVFAYVRILWCASILFNLAWFKMFYKNDPCSIAGGSRHHRNGTCYTAVECESKGERDMYHSNT